MNAFLINSKDGVSEWISNFNQVQDEMERLEKIGVVSNVTVQHFKDNKLSQEFTYNYDGQNWEKA